MDWLSAYAIAAIIAAVMALPERKLALLCCAFALNSVMFSFVPITEYHYLIAALSDTLMALLAIKVWCSASRWVIPLSLFLMVTNICIYAWRMHPIPYEAFMNAYTAYPYIVRAIEISQLIILFAWTPAGRLLVKRLKNPVNKGEPPCHLVTQHRLSMP